MEVHPKDIFQNSVISTTDQAHIWMKQQLTPAAIGVLILLDYGPRRAATSCKCVFEERREDH
ncbi:hypothetical protein SCLCIDRAFT_1223337, partial [Scleroderma citrinum Foug A]